MKTLIRILLVVSFAWLGLVAGALIAALWLVPKGAGLAGGAIVLGYAVLGALGMAVIGIVLAVKLAWRTLRVVAVIALTLTVLSGVVFAIRLIQRQSAVGDSDKDYAGLAHYTLRLENSESVEKSGFRTLDVDTRRRQGTSRAEHQRKTARALDNLSKLGDEVFTQCRETAAQADRV
ncbi:MAG: hypothetical protein GY953_39660, partial [bacterium]|nr:hypothetical protein [bacterium]